MGKIFCIMGKSSSGKDSLYRMLLQNKNLQLSKVVLYTTRPIRSGEKDGREYYFVNEKQLEDYLQAGKVIELRTYASMHGPWSYFTVDDGQICLEEKNYLMIATLESYEKISRYFGKDSILPIYIEVEDGKRLQRALDREKSEQTPRYAELCRRFLADAEDFSEEKILHVGIQKRFYNEDLDEIFEEISTYIQSSLKE